MTGGLRRNDLFGTLQADLYEFARLALKGPRACCHPEWAVYCLQKSPSIWADGKYRLLNRNYKLWRGHDVGFTAQEVIRAGYRKIALISPFRGTHPDEVDGVDQETALARTYTDRALAVLRELSDDPKVAPEERSDAAVSLQYWTSRIERRKRESLPFVIEGLFVSLAVLHDEYLSHVPQGYRRAVARFARSLGDALEVRRWRSAVQNALPQPTRH